MNTLELWPAKCSPQYRKHIEGKPGTRKGKIELKWEKISSKTCWVFLHLESCHVPQRLSFRNLQQLGLDKLCLSPQVVTMRTISEHRLSVSKQGDVYSTIGEAREVTKSARVPQVTIELPKSPFIFRQ